MNNNFVSISVQLHYHRNFQKTHYPEISVQSPGSNRASASRLRRLFKRNLLCVLSPTPHYGRRGERSGKREPRGRKPKGRGESAFLSPLGLSPSFIAATLLNRIANPRSAVRQTELSEACFHSQIVITHINISNNSFFLQTAYFYPPFSSFSYFPICL